MRVQPALDRRLQGDSLSLRVLREDGHQQNFYKNRHGRRITFGLWDKQRADERHMTREERAPEHGESELVDCMNCLVSSVPQSLEIETGPPGDKVVCVRTITHAVRSRGGLRHVLWAGWTLCGTEFVRSENGDGLECDGNGWAIPVGPVPGARGPRDSSDP